MSMICQSFVRTIQYSNRFSVLNIIKRDHKFNEIERTRINYHGTDGNFQFRDVQGDKNHILPDITDEGYFLVKCELNISSWQWKYLRWWCWAHQDNPGLPSQRLWKFFQLFQNLGQDFYANLQTFLVWYYLHLKFFLCLSLHCSASLFWRLAENLSAGVLYFLSFLGDQALRCGDCPLQVWLGQKCSKAFGDLPQMCFGLMKLVNSLQKRNVGTPGTWQNIHIKKRIKPFGQVHNT